MNQKSCSGTVKYRKSPQDYYIDPFNCTDNAVEHFIEARRDEFREEWFEYLDKFFD